MNFNQKNLFSSAEDNEITLFLTQLTDYKHVTLQGSIRQFTLQEVLVLITKDI